MNIYVIDDDFRHNDIVLIQKMMDGRYNIYNTLTDPHLENSLFLMDADWINILSAENNESIKSLKNKKVVFFDHYKNLQDEMSTIRCKMISDWITDVNFDKKNVYNIVQMAADVEKLKPYFNIENITVYDKWMEELYRYQVKDDLLTVKRNVDSRKKPNKRFCFFNRRYETIRFAFIAELISSGLLNEFNYTFSDNWKMHGLEKVPHEMIRSDIPNHLEPHREQLENWITGLPYTVNAGIANLYPNQLNDLFRASNISIVLETHPITDRSIITEKTYKAMYFERPFMILSQPGALKMLKISGYKTFSPLIDESYDDIQDYNERVQAVIKEIKRLHDMPIEQFDELVNQCKPIIEYNYKHLLSEMYKPWPSNFKMSNLLKFE
jgi:hypothetical protein